ncbi:MAG: 23S rRNA (adenine(2503)-C(2))-methyltransferase RlmN [Planctomycetes bacterium]|nr:23S rRNA (adenine(2503)-C(2))-methyltransferase RlmN [Planctomycetota bacterium]
MPPDAHTHQIDCLGLTSEEAVAAARDRLGVAVNTSLPAYRRIFREGVRSVGPLHVNMPEVVRTLREPSNEGEVIKFVCRVAPVASPDPEHPLASAPLETESVLIPMIGSAGRQTYTLCLSSQVGCAMGCTFCETAQMGLIRSLTPAEIVAQWYAATHEIGIRPSNIVFMGMGEPMDNYDNVMQAVAVLKDHNGAGAALSRITISTVGRVDGLRKMREQITKPGWHRLNLALSLNSPNDADRSAIMPINRKWSLRDLQQELATWPRYGGNKLCIEYVLIPGVNDSRAHATQIADFMRPLVQQVLQNPTGDPEKDTRIRAVLNLIPYNPRRNSPWPAPTEESVQQFMDWLIEEHVFVKRRRTKGRRMMGACGQLGNEGIRRRQVVPLTQSAKP